MASQISSLTIIYSTVYSDTNLKKTIKAPRHRWSVNSPAQIASNEKMFPFDDVITTGNSGCHTYLRVGNKHSRTAASVLLYLRMFDFVMHIKRRPISQNSFHKIKVTICFAQRAVFRLTQKDPKHGGEPQRRSCEGNTNNKHPVRVQQPSCEEIDNMSRWNCFNSWKITEIFT